MVGLAGAAVEDVSIGGEGEVVVSVRPAGQFAVAAGEAGRASGSSGAIRYVESRFQR